MKLPKRKRRSFTLTNKHQARLVLVTLGQEARDCPFVWQCVGLHCLNMSNPAGWYTGTHRGVETQPLAQGEAMHTSHGRARGQSIICMSRCHRQITSSPQSHARQSRRSCDAASVRTCSAQFLAAVHRCILPHCCEVRKCTQKSAGPAPQGTRRPPFFATAHGGLPVWLPGPCLCTILPSASRVTPGRGPSLTSPRPPLPPCPAASWTRGTAGRETTTCFVLQSSAVESLPGHTAQHSPEPRYCPCCDPAAAGDQAGTDHSSAVAPVSGRPEITPTLLVHPEDGTTSYFVPQCCVVLRSA